MLAFRCIRCSIRTSAAHSKQAIHWVICNRKRCSRTLGSIRPLTQNSRHSFSSASAEDRAFLETYKKSYQLSTASRAIDHATPSHRGQRVTIAGFIRKRRDISDKLSFVDLYKDDRRTQVVSRGNDALAAHDTLKSIRLNSAVSVTGVVELKPKSKASKAAKAAQEEQLHGDEVEVVLEDIQCLAEFPEDIIVSDDVQFSPQDRHLQIRFDDDLRKRLRFRNEVLRACRTCLPDFQEIETPILFKSTPEGAREFLVPTRRRGYAYALPQSPQQYKQILMASGISRYFQIAKCFRDEDLRADRQPEFTQIDMEMSFASGEDVILRMEQFIKELYAALQPKSDLPISVPSPPFARMTYTKAMDRHGIDKPDLRIQDLIYRIDQFLPPDLMAMLTSIQKPVVEAFRFRLPGTASLVRKFVQDFMDSPDSLSFQQNPDGPPGVFVYDPRKPLEGLQAFGYAGLESLKEFYESNTGDPEPFEEGDLIIVQARKDLSHSGGSTALGRLRLALFKAAVARGLLELDASQHFLWVTDFPLFTLNNDSDPGQGGNAGFSATHHPFTAPKTPDDVDLLLKQPLQVIADHYDLVVNGVELGGGSRRIHDAEMQVFIMKDILKMPEERLKDFSHLFKMLRAGCPPHAGIALGLDRLVAVMLGRDSVRDVIAFPKSGKGEDLMVNSPSPMTRDQQATYHLQLVN